MCKYMRSAKPNNALVGIHVHVFFNRKIADWATITIKTGLFCRTQMSK